MVAKDKENTKLHMDDEHIFQTSDNDCNKLVKELERKEALRKLKKKCKEATKRLTKLNTHKETNQRNISEQTGSVTTSVLFCSI